VLRDFKVNGFRTFSYLELPRLGRVNLIVGKNNVGKTMLLEALRLYASQGNPLALRNLLLERDEILTNFTPSETDEGDLYLKIASLFNRDAMGKTRNSFSFGTIKEGGRTLEVRLVPVRRIRREREAIYSYAYEVADPKNIDSDLELTLGLLVSEDGNEKLYPYQLFNSEPGRRYMMPRLTDALNWPVFVSARGAHSRDIARWWDVVALKESEERVYECMRIIAPVERINFIENPFRRSDRIAMVRLKGQSDPLPLKSFGDGMGRLFQIALAMEYARSNKMHPHGTLVQQRLPLDQEDVVSETMLLIDEIENGIHYTAHSELWKFVVGASKLYDVQVFATSHSWDCINGLRWALEKKVGDDVKLIRLEQHGERNKAVVFDQHELPIITQDDIEVR
jgi:AAA domain, putative AbiEii toxin, Type IV TA system